MRRADRTASWAEAAAVVPWPRPGRWSGWQLVGIPPRRPTRDAIPTGKASGADVAAEVVARIAVGPDAVRVAVGAGMVWVTDHMNGRLLRVEG
jgi:hypothetical protein